LDKHVPAESLPLLKKWFNQRPFELVFAKQRSSKYGDFRGSKKNQLSRISVNSNLNQYAFLITLTHEFAHLLVWDKHQNKVKAHGKEWKTEFNLLMTALLKKEVFPKHLAKVILIHIQNPPASSARDVNLIKELKKYDTPSDLLQLSELPEGSIFILNKKRKFIKGKKKRTRYLCQEISTKKEYLIHGVAEVETGNIVNN
jgi:hypothetical protein